MKFPSMLDQRKVAEKSRDLINEHAYDNAAHRQSIARGNENRRSIWKKT